MKKLGIRRISALFVGYPEQRKDYMLVDEENGEGVVSRGVTFDESPGVNYSAGSEADPLCSFEDSKKSENEQPLDLDAQRDVVEKVGATKTENTDQQKGEEDNEKVPQTSENQVHKKRDFRGTTSGSQRT